MKSINKTTQDREKILELIRQDMKDAQDLFTYFDDMGCFLSNSDTVRLARLIHEHRINKK